MPGTVRWQANTLVFTPGTSLDSSIRYVATVASSAAAATGQATLSRAFHLSFRVAAPPRVVSTLPAQNTTSNNFGVEFHFSSPMQQRTLDRRLTVVPPLADMYTSSYGASYSVGGSFKPSTTYTVTIDGGARDRFGRVLPGPYVLRFTTAPLPPSVSLMGRPGIYSGIAFSAGRVVDAPVQIINLPHVHYTLLQTRPGAAIKVAGGCGGQPPTGRTLRDWVERVPHPLDRVERLSVRLAHAGGGPLEPGIYWLGAQIPADVAGVQNNGAPQMSELVVASNVGITAKSGDGQTLVWVTSARTGKPLTHTAVHLLDADGSTVSSGRTDARGVVLFHASMHDRWAAVVDDGQSFGMTVNDWTAQAAQAANIFGQPQSSPEPSGTYAYTDRPIYRPGQRVYFRAMLWRDNDAQYSLYGPRTVQVRAFESAGTGGGGRQIYTAKLRLDRFGSVQGALRLPARAMTGTYHLEFNAVIGKYQQAYAATQFNVAEYRKPEFLTSVSTDHVRYVQGQTIDASVRVQYVFGAPVTGQRVNWAAYTQDRRIPPPGWEVYTFGDQDAIEQQAQTGISPAVGMRTVSGIQVAQGQGTTDDFGRLHFHVPVDIAKQVEDQTITVEATVMDINHQSVSGRTQVAAHKAAFSLGLLPSSLVVPSGQRETVDVAAVQDDGSPVAGKRLVATIYQRTFSTVLSAANATAGLWQRRIHDRLIASHQLTTGARGRVHVGFTPTDGGIYYVVVEGKDGGGNTARSGLSVYASSTGFSDVGQTGGTAISLKADKASYHVGDTAHVLVAAPFDRATALVTLERASIHSARVEHLTSNTSTVDVPITGQDVPNVYVGVAIYHGWRKGSPPDWRYGVANLHVNVDPKRLLVHVTQDRLRYHPGDPVTYTVKTSDVRGHPVSAQVSLSLVDTAVLALQDETNADILQVLYGERGQGVRTSSDGVASMDSLSPGQISGIGPRCGLGGGGDGFGGLASPSSGLAQTSPSGIKLRRRFADTAYWTATLVTNGAGTATATVRLPDNLTTWRLDARAVSADQRVGRSLLRTKSTQDVIVRPVAPRFFLQGDSLKIGAIVNNNVARAISTEVRIAATGLTLTSSSHTTVTVPAHGERLVLWPVHVPPGTTASLTFAASPSGSNVHGDAVQVSMPVHVPLTGETVATTGQVFQSTKQVVVVPHDAKDRPGELTVALTSSLTAGMGAAFSAFMPTPYPSNEDIADRVLAAAALRPLSSRLTGLSPSDYSSLTPAIDLGVRRLVANQRPDGGWAWYDDAWAQSDASITANVVEALTEAHADGPLVAAALRSAREYLRSALRDVAADERIHILFVLARSGKPDNAPVRALYADTVGRAHLAPASIADLALAMKFGGEKAHARSLIALLDSKVMVSATGAHWEGMSVRQGQSATATTAEVLAALVREAPDDVLVPAAARWLLLARQGNAWDCPPISAHALLALSGYARAVHEGKADYRYRVMVDDRTTLMGAFANDAGQEAGTVRMPLGGLHRGGSDTLVVRREAVNGALGMGPLYYLTRLQYFLPATAIQPRSEGIVVSRRYLSMAGQPIDSVAAGSAVKVVLTLHTDQTLEYLHVDDPIPAGFEPIDQSLLISRQGLFPAQQLFLSYGNPTSLTPYLTHTDLRDDRTSLFAPSLPPGTYTYTYLAQATTVGQYDIAPTHAEEAFFPEVFGRGAGQPFTVR
ncbi:MAG: alpha-2-macroglobulin [Chloroflexota bacterium]